ncbi:hypothetical protein [Paenibacillus cymbidii]|uniref:hypothetical protein n=1 Tax=Paenibacillus cymbidii TaxID=1639034 RepID=UPI001080AF91|nr:hypothetical protein [Paenibacillus cymbidii]
MVPITQIAAVLEPNMDKTSATVEWELTLLLDWVKMTYTEETDAGLTDNLFRYTKGLWNGLFPCYDHYYLPRTNNELEQFF